MEKGYLLLIGNYCDLVHYVKIANTYYTLSRDHVEKIEDIEADVQFYIKIVDLEELRKQRDVDPYFLEEPKLSAEMHNMIQADSSFKPITIAVNRNQKAINKFQNLSVENNFAYFDNLDQEEVVLIEYNEQ